MIVTTRHSEANTMLPAQEETQTSLLLLAQHGPLIEVVSLLDDKDVLQIRACDRTLFRVLTKGLFAGFWMKRLIGASKGDRIVRFIEALTISDSEFDDFREYLWSKRLFARFQRKKSMPSLYRIQVCARFRPQRTTSSTSQGAPFINDDLLLATPSMLVRPSNGKQWVLDRFLPMDTTASDAFCRIAGSKVQDLLCGLNGCILAYGQTGSGKSHTILGSERGEMLDGILPTCVLRVLDFLNMEKNDRITGALTLSVCEVYREKAQTLLPLLHIRTAQDLQRALARVQSRRVTGSTAMNKGSSRSHCLFTLQLRQFRGRESIRSELKIVDLAGSERLKRAQLEKFGGKERLNEGISINLSLSCLSRAINSLATGAAHIPFNDSLLTRMLRSALGGEAGKTSTTLSIVCCCSSDMEDLEETRSTLQFGAQASSVRLVCQSAAPEEFQSIIQLRSKLFLVESEMMRLQQLWTRAGEDRHETFCRCDRCIQVLDQKLLDPEHMRRWHTLTVERDVLRVEIDVLQNIVIERAGLQLNRN